MKKLALGFLSLVMVAALGISAYAQGGGRGTSNLTLKGKTVSVDYGQPSLKGRTTDELLGELPAGGFWRMGNNKSTTLKTDLDLAFGNVAVPAGEYSLWMQRQEDKSWKLVFNKQHGQWGTNHDASQDFASVPMTASQASAPVEMVTITLRKQGGGGEIVVEWGTLKASASFKAK